MKRFKLLPVTISDDHVETYVAIDYYFRPSPIRDGSDICLSNGCVEAREIDAEIDELISELNELRKAAHRRFGQLRRAKSC